MAVKWRELGLVLATGAANVGAPSSAGTRPSLGQAKLFGGLGSIFLLLTFIPYAGPVLGILGLVFVLLAVKDISQYFNDRAIFKNMIMAVVLAIVGIVVGTLVVFATIFRYFGLGNMAGPNFNPANLPPGDFAAFVVAIVVGLLVIWALFLVSAIYMRRSYDAISTKLNVGMFSTAALIYLIGAALTIFLVGFLLIFVAQILFVVAFFSIPETVTQGRPAAG
jgi:uncharacterized membrane protein